MSQKQVGNPELDRGMQDAKHRHRDRMTQHAMHQRPTPMLFGEAVPVRNEGAPSIEVELRLATEEFDAQILRKERPAPAIVIAAHERDRDAPGADLLQLGDRGNMFARDDGLILAPELEEITCQHEVIDELEDLL